MSQIEISSIFKLKKSSKAKEQTINKLIENSNENMKEVFWANKGEYLKFRVNDIFSWSEEISSEKLYLWSNSHPQILKELKHISFPNLKEMNVGWNKITSIEALSEMDFPFLIDLCIRDNLVSSMKPMRKVNFPKLKNLILRANLIEEIDFLNELFPSPLHILNLNANDLNNLDCLFKTKPSETRLMCLMHFKKLVDGQGANIRCLKLNQLMKVSFKTTM